MFTGYLNEHCNYSSLLVMSDEQQQVTSPCFQNLAMCLILTVHLLTLVVDSLMENLMAGTCCKVVRTTNIELLMTL